MPPGKYDKDSILLPSPSSIQREKPQLAQTGRGPCFGIIPARYASNRFPGKPLADILGKPMFLHVWERASRCAELQSVTLATDDRRIFDAAKERGVPVIMTSAEHQSGTDRIREAAVRLGLPRDSIVANIQGDEPALEPGMLSQLLEPFRDPAVRVSTLARPMEREEAALPDRVKVITAKNGDALYFSRASIPFIRDGEYLGPPPYLLHVGLYAFRLEALEAFTGFAPSPLEQLEKLEQLRFLENNIPIRVALTRHLSHGVDRPEDLPKILEILLKESQ